MEALRGLRTTEQLRSQRLREAAARQQLAERAAQEAAALTAARVATASRLRRTEQEEAAARANLLGTERRSAQQDAAIAAGQRAIAALLPAAVRLAFFPDETLLGAPGGLADTLAGLAVAQDIGNRLAAEQAALRVAEARSRALAEAATAQRTELAKLEAYDARQTAQLESATAQAQTESQLESAASLRAAQAAAALAARAATLRDAIAAMDRAEAAASRRRHRLSSEPAIPAGSGRAPVAGRIVQRFGAPAEAGPATGVTIAALPGAIVTSPCGGHVAFAAPFRSYGKLLIVQCGGGRDVVLAGLDRLDTQVGRPVTLGEPLGRMASPGPAALYVELREGGQPRDPVPFLSALGSG